MATAQGFGKTGYTASQIYQKDGIFPDEVNSIAKLKGFQSPFSEDQRTQIKAFVAQAKANSETINQAVQAKSAQSAPAPNFEPAPAPEADPMDTVTDEFSASAKQQQDALMAQAFDAAIGRKVIVRVADNLAGAKLAMTGWDLSKYPQWQTMLNQSEQILRQAEETDPVALPFSQMFAIALGDVPMLNGKLPALSTTATLVLPAASEAVAI